jgi:hypothetical protein
MSLDELPELSLAQVATCRRAHQLSTAAETCHWLWHSCQRQKLLLVLPSSSCWQCPATLAALLLLVCPTTLAALLLVRLMHLQLCCGPLLLLLLLLLASDQQPAAHLLRSGARLG